MCSYTEYQYVYLPHILWSVPKQHNKKTCYLEAGSWNRGDYIGSKGHHPVSLPKGMLVPDNHQDYTIQLPLSDEPPMSSYGGDLPGYQGNPLYSDIATYGFGRPTSANRYQNGMYGMEPAGALYDPTTLTNPKLVPRCGSAMGDRSMSPMPQAMLQRNYSDRSSAKNMYTSVDYYPRSSPMHMLSEAEPKVGLLPQSYYPAPILSSHSSLDKMESGSTLSAIPSRLGDQYETSSHLGRMSQSSRASSRPLNTRMATHV